MDTRRDWGSEVEWCRTASLLARSGCRWSGDEDEGGVKVGLKVGEGQAECG